MHTKKQEVTIMLNVFILHFTLKKRLAQLLFFP